jgi:type 1 glutamine amidotransferase/Ca2+-binding EF-hand superfamily protein
MGRIRINWLYPALSAALLASFAIGFKAQAQGGGQAAEAIFSALDKDGDGFVTKSEMDAGFADGFSNWNGGSGDTLTKEQITAGLREFLPSPPKAKPGQSGTFNIDGNSTPIELSQKAVDAMMAALPSTPGAKPHRARKVLVLAHTGPSGFVHASIPLAAKTVEALGNKGDLWTTTLSYDAAVITTENLKQYDAIFLDSTTSCFLDDQDPSVTAARRAAFLNFVRSGKGIAGIHASTDAYHTNCEAALALSKSGSSGPNQGATVLASQLIAAGGNSGAESVTKQQWMAAGDGIFQKLDTGNTGKVSRADFVQHFRSALPAPGPRAGGEPKVVQQWPEYNKLIGGFFKFHWSDPQLIYVKIDDPKSPLTAMFHGQEFEIHDETYTFEQDSFSRKNVHVLTSIDYAKMSAEDKAKESNPRTDADYALSYIRREGKGRVFYEGHGHSDRVYAMTPMLEHIRAGIQYALGDLKADDSPSAK